MRPGRLRCGACRRIGARSPGARHDACRILGGALGQLHLVPQVQHLGGVVRARLAEHVRMAADHLRVHVVDIERARIGRYLALQHHLQQHVAQLLAQVRRVAGLDGVHRLVGLLDHVMRDAPMRLRAVPWAPVRSAQCGDGGHEIVEARVVDGRDGRGRKFGLGGHGRFLSADGLQAVYPSSTHAASNALHSTVQALWQPVAASPRRVEPRLAGRSQHARPPLPEA